MVTTEIGEYLKKKQKIREESKKVFLKCLRAVVWVWVKTWAVLNFNEQPWLLQSRRMFTMPCGDIWAKMRNCRHLWSSKSMWQAQKMVSLSVLFIIHDFPYILYAFALCLWNTRTHKLFRFHHVTNSDDGSKAPTQTQHFLLWWCVAKHWYSNNSNNYFQFVSFCCFANEQKYSSCSDNWCLY